MDWVPLYPCLAQTPSLRVEIVDVGCGYGGLLLGLSPLFPDKLILGIEIRIQVTNYILNKIKAIRLQYSQLSNGHGTSYSNIAALRTNAMKFLPNLFQKAQLTKIFFCFPDPHFKSRKHRYRIIT